MPFEHPALKREKGKLLRTLAARYAKSSVGAELEIEAAELMLDEPERRGEAVDSLLRAWEEDPAEARVASLLKRVLAEDGRIEELVKVLRGTIAAIDGSAEPAVVAHTWPGEETAEDAAEGPALDEALWTGRPRDFDWGD